MDPRFSMHRGVDSSPAAVLLTSPSLLLVHWPVSWFLLYPDDTMLMNSKQVMELMDVVPPPTTTSDGGPWKNAILTKNHPDEERRCNRVNSNSSLHKYSLISCCLSQTQSIKLINNYYFPLTGKVDSVYHHLMIFVDGIFIQITGKKEKYSFKSWQLCLIWEKQTWFKHSLQLQIYLNVLHLNPLKKWVMRFIKWRQPNQMNMEKSGVVILNPHCCVVRLRFAYL